VSNRGLSVRRWSAEEDEVLRRLYPRSSRPEIEKALPGRTQKAIGYRAEILGVRCERRPIPSKIVSPVIVRDGIEGKACILCLEWKPLEKFVKRKTCAGGRQGKCTTCASAESRKLYPGTYERGQRAWRRRNPEKVYLRAMRGRAVKAGVEVHPITVDELRGLKALYGGLCAYCRVRSGDTLDHVVPLSRGGEHSVANLVPACFRCNHSKKDLSVEEWSASDRVHNPFRGEKGELKP
jgi:5-methylcytosine-specific restriction endonuclease McrA